MKSIKEILQEHGGLVSAHTAGVLVVMWLSYCILRAIYNISPLHPLHRFPGPKLAAMSWVYEFYFDVIRHGTYTLEIKRLHATHGPIIRINPDELHCIDPRFVDEIYAAGGRKRDKFHHTVGSLAPPMTLSGFATIGHELHRRRREPMSRFFSKANIAKLDRKIHDTAQQLCDKILAWVGKDEPLEITAAYSCFATDIVSECCFGDSFGLLEKDSFEPNFRNAALAFVNTYFVFRFFPFLKYLSLVTPFIAKYLPQDVALLNDTIFVTIPGHIKKARQEFEGKAVKTKETVFDSLFDSDLPPEEKTNWRLAAEGTILVAAGTETTAWAIAVITVYLLSNQGLLKRLIEELKPVVTDPRDLPSWTTLEQLPLLNATIAEGMRLSYGVSIRTPRVPAGEDMIYRGKWTPPGSSTAIEVEHVIPRGYPIGMSTVLTHHDETIFPDSDSFNPDRFLDEKGQRKKHLDKYIMSFSKGSRVCLGMNLAYCETYLVVAALILRVLPHMQLYETTIDNVKYDHDLFIPMPKAGSRGTRVLLKEDAPLLA